MTQGDAFALSSAGKGHKTVEQSLQLKDEAERFRPLAKLAKLRQEAPAIFLWEFSLQDD